MSVALRGHPPGCQPDCVTLRRFPIDPMTRPTNRQAVARHCSHGVGGAKIRDSVERVCSARQADSALTTAWALAASALAASVARSTAARASPLCVTQRAFQCLHSLGKGLPWPWANDGFELQSDAQLSRPAEGSQVHGLRRLAIGFRVGDDEARVEQSFCHGSNGALLDSGERFAAPDGDAATCLSVTRDTVRRMGAKGLQLGERGQTSVTPMKQDADGKWKRAASGRSADRWRARCFVRGHDGVMREVSRVAATRVDAEQLLERALTEQIVGNVEMTAEMPLVVAGRLWLEQIARTDSRLSERTVTDYTRTFARYIDRDGSSLRGLSLAEANNPQRLRAFLQRVADTNGTGAAKIARSVLSGIFGLALDNGATPSNAMRHVRHVEAQTPRPTKRKGDEPRDTRRAFTRKERDALVAHADALAGEPVQLPSTARKRQATADLVAFLAGTGVRITEARALRWEDVNLTKGTADVHGTKSKSARRRLTLPEWLTERLRRRAETLGEGYVFASPHLTTTAEVMWDQSNCAKAVRDILLSAGLPWATPHTFRRTVATLAHEAGAPLSVIADQLGHADPSMTARVYLGRDPMGDRESLAQYL
ncbi:MAG: site-specific integrase [Frankiales bacterium]|nr:site-specific integrase [Frankiales bacterium]